MNERTTTLLRRSRPTGARNPRRGSVLVLVVTMLGVLFVVGIAFLATMNFEAESIAAQSRRGEEEKVVQSVSSNVGSALRSSFLAGPDFPFSEPLAAAAAAPFAELPFVHGNFSPIEPFRHPGDDGETGTADDYFVGFGWHTDLAAMQARPFTGPTLPPDTPIDTGLPQGFPIVATQVYDAQTGTTVQVGLRSCLDGVAAGRPCGNNLDCPGSICYSPSLIDADGDGIVDSFLSLASNLGLSPSEIAVLSSKVNPPTNPEGRVFAAVRVVPHGGMVNLNEAHPALIENVLDLGFPITAGNRDPSTDYFYHRPSAVRSKYATQVEEPILRRRVLLPSELPPPSALQGDPFAATAFMPHLNGDLAQFLLPPNSGDVGMESVSLSTAPHRFGPFTPCGLGGDCIRGVGGDFLDLWQVRMEPFTSSFAEGAPKEYDRRHLLTTIGHDDLLARGARVHVVNTIDGTADIVAKMREANRADYSPNLECDAQNDILLPFEYANYPQDIPNKTLPDVGQDSCDCPNSPGCQFNPRKGRLQLSLAWLQEWVWAPLNGPASLRELTVIDRPWSQRNLTLLAALERRERVEVLIYDTFAMMLQNLIGPDWETRPVCKSLDGCPAGHYCRIGADPTNPLDGRCSAVAPYWDDVECIPFGTNQCSSGEICVAFPSNPNLGLCTDSWTGQRRSQALLSRTAASLTANLLDFADADDEPTRIALRSFDYNRGECYSGTAVRLPCQSSAECGGAPCIPSSQIVGRRIDGAPATTDVEPIYVYGLERQPYITAIATEVIVPNMAPDPQPPEPGDAILTGWVVELFNPHTSNLPTNGTFWLYEAPPNAQSLAGAPRVSLDWPVGASGSGGPFTVVSWSSSETSLLGGFTTPLNGTRHSASLGTPPLKLEEGSTLYLVHSFQFLGDSNPTEIVIDQFKVGGVNGNIGKEGEILTDVVSGDLLPPGNYAFVLARAVEDSAVNSHGNWLATVPIAGAETMITEAPPGQVAAALGTWHAPDPVMHAGIHPVEVNFANVGLLSDFFPRLSVAFPTTGSLLFLMRHANRGTADFTPSRSLSGFPWDEPVHNLAFTSGLREVTNFNVGVLNSMGNVIQVNASINSAEQIDNGRMPIFDLGQRVNEINTAAGRLAAHHVPPQITPAFNPAGWGGGICCHPTMDDNCNWRAACATNNDCTAAGTRTTCRFDRIRVPPGNLNQLPWGQTVFDYFTALPLSSPGPYPPCSPNDPNCPPQPPTVDPAAVPRVDLGGLRVHGRINLNAAPWKVMAGLPFMPMERVPLPFRSTVQSSLGILVPANEAASAGKELAQGITAYREAREIRYRDIDPDTGLPTTVTTGDYGEPRTGVTDGYRGWTMGQPLARRGTGLMSVGELANIRHPDASKDATLGTSFFRADAGVVDPTNANANAKNFIAAAAPLVALSDWVTVRSQVFTVYGVFRGEEDVSIAHADAQTQLRLRTEDVNSRAIRFQETIDRLPTFLGAPMPARVGDRTVAPYTDLRND